MLVGRAELVSVLQPWGKSPLFVLPAGHIPPSPSEVLGSARMAHLIPERNATFGVVIFDTLPRLPAADAAILAKNECGAIIVVAALRMQKKQLRDSIFSLNDLDDLIYGLVRTMRLTKEPDAFGYGRYGCTSAIDVEDKSPSAVGEKG